MTQPVRRQCESNIYHVVSRGAGKQIIFECDDDKGLFNDRLSMGCAKYPVSVYAWCLMDNHIHLLLAGTLDTISALMRDVLSMYAIGFNSRYGREGHLFQGRFLSEPIESEGHLLAAVRYIHQNPKKAGMAPMETYRWSSYGEYLYGIPPKGVQVLADTSLLLNMLGSVEQFAAFHNAESSDHFLEPDDSKTNADGKRALRIAIEELGEEGMLSVKSLPKEKRNEALARLRKQGLSLRQIERLTGVNRSQISRLGKQNGTKRL